MRKRPNLVHFPLIPLVGAGHVVSQRLGAGKVMVAARCGDDIALAGDLAGEAGDGTGDLVDLAEEDDTGEAAAAHVLVTCLCRWSYVFLCLCTWGFSRVGIVWDGRVEDEDAHRAVDAVGGRGHICVGFFDQHGG